MSTRIERERTDKLDRLKESLRRQALPFLCAGGGPLDDAARCTIAAHEAAQRGDLDEAELQLRFRDQPKWYRESDCAIAYRHAMNLKRGVSV